MTDYIDAILAAIREALGKPAVYSGARHFTDQQAALAAACTPANMAALIAHIDAQAAHIDEAQIAIGREAMRLSRIANLEKMVTDRNERIADLERVSRDDDDEIDRKAARIAELERELDDVMADRDGIKAVVVKFTHGMAYADILLSERAQAAARIAALYGALAAVLAIYDPYGEAMPDSVAGRARALLTPEKTDAE